MSDKTEKVTRYRGGEDQTVFPIAFPSLENSQIRAEILDAVGRVSVLVAGTDFIINRVSDGDGELILLGAALERNSILTITVMANPERGGVTGEPAAVTDSTTMEVVQEVEQSVDGTPPAMEGDYDMEGRVHAYRVEADPIRDAALSYYAEAKGWRIAGDAKQEKKALSKARSKFWLYAEKKRDIRERFPDPKGIEQPDYPDNAVAVAEEQYYLTASGVYHAMGCACTTAIGEWLGKADIQVKRPTARPCGRCRPPGLEAPE